MHLDFLCSIPGVFHSEENLFHAKSSIKHIEKWSDKNPKLAFKPHIPSSSSNEQPPRKKTKIETHDDDLVSRHQRARIFAQWIVNKFGLERLKKGHILDIAGGKGDLAFELALKYDLQCIVIDPRGVAFQSKRKYQRKMLKKKKATASSLYQSMEEEFNRGFFEKHEELSNKISLVLGLHPDQATEPLIDTALAFDLPFAVIPCCVFAHENPHRMLGNGEKPNTYELFCDFLAEKNPNIATDNLSFRGRNKVLFKI